MSPANGEAEPSVGSILSAFADTTTMHGVARAGSPEKMRAVRVGWLLLVLAATGWAIYNVTLITMNFMSFPVSTIVTLRFEDKLHFPAVTICNLNQLRKSQFEGNVELDELRKEISELLETLRPRNTTPGTSINETITAITSSNDDTEFDYQEYETYDEGIKVKDRAIFDMDEKIRTKIRGFKDQMDVNSRLKMGHYLSRMLIACRYKSNFNCKSSHFTPFYNHYYGNCYTFNKAPTVSKPGPVHGLSLMLNVESEEYIKYTETVGFKVVIHPKKSMPFPENEGIVVSPGFATSIAVQRVDIRRSPPPHGDCYDHSEKENRRLNMYALPPYKVDYTDKACQRTCFQRTVVDICGCCDGDYPCGRRNPAIPAFNRRNVTRCQGRNVGCLTRTRRHFEWGRLGCGEECAPSCSETTFTEEVSTGVWPSEGYVKELPEKFRNFPKELLNYTDVANFRKNVARVDVYYKQLNYEKIETVPAYDWYRLLSDLGGQLGLWLGFSVLTAVEFLELTLVVIRHAVRNLRNTGNTTGRASTKDKEVQTTPA